MTRYFATTAPGLDALAAGELRQLGIAPLEAPVNPQDWQASGEDSGGGVVFEGGLEELYRANLWLRTASRVLARLGDFTATAFPDLRKKTSRLPWEKYLTPGQPVMLHVTCHKSKLYHSGAVAERVLAAIGDRLGKPSPMVKAELAVGKEAADAPAKAAQGSAVSPMQIPPQLIVVRNVHDHCTISVDSSGALLHRRGYRLATAKAPLRETLAAAMLLASGWNARSPLLDPFCGSGTIAIEAALLALGIPPGLKRKFAFMRWPGYDSKLWESTLAAARMDPAGKMPIFQASDRDEGAVRIAQANAERAGVLERIEFTCRAVSAIEPPNQPGWVVTNPPYGIRVSEGKDLRNLYAQLGNVLRAHCPGWQVAVLCSDLRLLGQMGIKLDTSFSTINGGVKVLLGRGQVS